MSNSKMPVNGVGEIRTKTTAYFGVGAIEKINDIAANMKSQGISKVICVTDGEGYRLSGAWEYVASAFTKNGISSVIYDGVTTSPNVDQVDEAVKMAKEFGAKAVVAIGGGSPIDVAKSVSVLMEYNNESARDLFNLKFTPTRSAPVVAINTTHGTGSEVNRFSVLSIPEKNFKAAIGYDCMYPLYAIDDPQLTASLSPAETFFTGVNALTQATDAVLSSQSSPYAAMISKEAAKLVAKYLPKAIENPSDINSRYYMNYASLLSGIAIDSGLSDFNNAKGYPLSDHQNSLGSDTDLQSILRSAYSSHSEVLSDIYSPITGSDTKSSDAASFANSVQNWLDSVGKKANVTEESF